MREQIKKDGFNLYIHAKITVFSGTSPARVPRKSIELEFVVNQSAPSTLSTALVCTILTMNINLTI